MNCPTCDAPMVWSDTHARRWCAIYGDHQQPCRYPNSAGADLIRLVMTTPDTSRRGQHNRSRHLRSVA